MRCAQWVVQHDHSVVSNVLLVLELGLDELVCAIRTHVRGLVPPDLVVIHIHLGGVASFRVRHRT